MEVPEDVHIGRLPGYFAGRFDRAYARRRPQVIANAIRPAEALSGDDLFVIDSFAAVARFVLVRDVSFARERAESLVLRHTASLIGRRRYSEVCRTVRSLA